MFTLFGGPADAIRFAERLHKPFGLSPDVQTSGSVVWQRYLGLLEELEPKFLGSGY